MAKIQNVRQNLDDPELRTECKIFVENFNFEIKSLIFTKTLKFSGKISSFENSIFECVKKFSKREKRKKSSPKKGLNKNLGK